MRELEDHYEEEYIYLADLTCDAALISWGKFFFNSKMKLVEDRKVHMFDGQLGRHTSIGTNCESYGPVTVEGDEPGRLARHRLLVEPLAQLRHLGRGHVLRSQPPVLAPAPAWVTALAKELGERVPRRAGEWPDVDRHDAAAADARERPCGLAKTK